MQNTKLFVLFALLTAGPAFAPRMGPPAMQWMNIEEAQTSLKKEKRPVLIDLYTDWCGWCKVMDKKTYSNARVAAYLHDKFYAVKVNAETKEKIVWGDQTYQFSRPYRANEFALFLTKGRLEFPTTIILPADGSEPQAIAGFLDTKDLELLLKYFGEGGYNTIPFEDFQKHFKPSW